MLKTNDLRISISLLRKIGSNRNKKTKERRKENKKIAKRIMKLKWPSKDKKLHHMVMMNKITSQIQETLTTMMWMYKKDQTTGHFKRREDRRGTIILLKTKKIFLMTGINVKMSNVIIVCMQRVISQDNLEGINAINNNKIQIQWVMTITM
jgi:hypothetical protein